MKEAVELVTSELRKNLQEYRELKTRIAELQAAAAAIEADVKSHMGEDEELNVEGIKVRWTRYTESRFDTSAFREEHPALYKAYTRRSERRRFSVT